jgi:hypothetical protein
VRIIRALSLTLSLIAGAIAGVGCYPALHGGVVFETLPPPPPAAPYAVEAVPAAPGPNYFWVRGGWVWGGHQYAWSPGRWIARPSPYAVWAPAHWERHHNRYLWVGGRWRS